MALELTMRFLGRLDTPTVVQARMLIGPEMTSRTLLKLDPPTLGTTDPKTPMPPPIRLRWALLGPRVVLVAMMTTVVLVILEQLLVQTPTGLVNATLRVTLRVLFLVWPPLMLTRITLENRLSRTSVNVEDELMKL